MSLITSSVGTSLGKITLHVATWLEGEYALLRLLQVRAIMSADIAFETRHSSGTQPRQSSVELTKLLHVHEQDNSYRSSHVRRHTTFLISLSSR